MSENAPQRLSRRVRGQQYYAERPTLIHDVCRTSARANQSDWLGLQQFVSTYSAAMNYSSPAGCRVTLRTGLATGNFRRFRSNRWFVQRFIMS